MPASKHNNNQGTTTTNNNDNTKKTYKSHHTDYRPFLRYIENHIGIDDTTVQRAEARLGKLSSNRVVTNKMAEVQNTNMNRNDDGSLNSFSTQTASAKKTKAERDDERHEDLHKNYKTKDFTDRDKIFLMKREIDSLRGTIKKQRLQQQQGATAGGLRGLASNNIPLVSVLLFFGVALVAVRSVKRKLWRLRASDSLLAGLDIAGNGGGGGADRNYEYAQASSGGGGDTEIETTGVELRSYEAPTANDLEIRFV